MRKLVATSQFKREAKKNFADLLTAEWAEVLHSLLNDIPLPEKYRDHPLKGDLSDYRECHIKPDLLYLARLGSHSELFG